MTSKPVDFTEQQFTLRLQKPQGVPAVSYTHLYLTYKSKGLMVREEYNLPLTRDAYLHLRTKTDGNLISKKRFLIPLTEQLTIELDIFDPPFAPLMMAEVEFPTEEMALNFDPPSWFGQDVTFDGRYHNSALSRQEYKSVYKNN